MKRKSFLILFFCILFTVNSLLTPEAFALGNAGYNTSDPEKSLGYRVCDFNYSYPKSSSQPNYQPYQERYVGNPQCVGYVYARIEEKLNLVKVGFSSGAGAKDMIGNAKDGTVVKSSTSSEAYTIRVHKNDKGAYLAANSFACFNGWGASGSLTSYGHVIYVEDIRTIDGVKYVYYSEGSNSSHKNNKDGILKKLSVSDFIGGSASSGAYMGCIVYVPENTCSHSYNSNGVCSRCNEYDISKDNSAKYTEFSLPRIYVTVDSSPFRTGPYQECPTPNGNTSAGSEISIVGKLTNSRDMLWYKSSDGRYVYSEHLKFVRNSVYMTDLSFTNRSSTGIRMNAKVHKPKGATSEAFGAYVLDTTEHSKLLFWLYSKHYHAKDPNGSRTRNSTSFNLYVDLLQETDIRLTNGHEYLMCLYVDVNGTRYYSDIASFTAGTSAIEDLSGSFKSIEPPDEDIDTIQNPQTETVSTPVATLKPTDVADYRAKEFIKENNACVVTKIVKKSGSHISRSGLTLFDASGNTIKTYWNNVTNVSDATTTFHSWYDIKNELGVTLVPSTTYQYQFHVTVDGSNYYSDVYHLTTKGTASNTPVVSMLPTDAEEYRAKEFITETNACVVTKIIKKAGSHISRSGVTLYDEYGNLITDHWDNVNNVRDTTTTFHSWYDFNAELGVTLRPYTVYQYRFHVTVDGSDYYGETYRFTTAGEPPRPSNAWISADRKDLQAGTSVLLRFGADNATHYSLLLEHNETGYSSEIIVDGMNEYTMLLTDEGSYAAKLRAYNDNGYESVSPVLRLNVAPSLGYPVLILNRTELPLSEELTVNYKTEGAVSSTLKVFSDNALLTSFELGADGEISLQFYEPGEYVLVLSAQDGFGGSIDGTPVYCSLLPANTNTLLEGRFIPMRSYRSGHFTDVTPNHWFEQNVSCAYELGLMEGTSNNLFKPLGNVTLAQAIAMAARLHNIYEGGSGKFSEGTVWYEVYVNYALDNGIIKSSDFDAGTIGKTVYNRYATRAEMAFIFSNALPEEALPAINSISAIPDVTAGNQYYIQILRFYEAGIVEGGNGHRYYPENNITRAEAAAIISRMALPELRLEFSL